MAIDAYSNLNDQTESIQFPPSNRRFTISVIHNTFTINPNINGEWWCSETGSIFYPANGFKLIHELSSHEYTYYDPCIDPMDIHFTYHEGDEVVLIQVRDHPCF